MKFILIGLILCSKASLAQVFNLDILKELESISLNDRKKRKCNQGDFKMKILGDTNGTIKISSKTSKLPKTREYFIYEESADFILAENMSMVNLDYLKGNLTPALIILKKKGKALILEGLSLKFQKNGFKENCLAGKDSITNLHCLSKDNGKANLRSFNNMITLEYKGDLIRDIASSYKKMVFSPTHKEFHGKSIRVAQGGDINRSIVLHNSQSTVNLTYTHKDTKLIEANCNLTL